MTKLRERKTRLTFETEAEVKYRSKFRTIVVEPDHEGHTVALRLKGTRVRYEASWHAIYDFAAKIFANHERTLRNAKRELKRLQSKKKRSLNDYGRMRDLTTAVEIAKKGR
jgi:hypothetical protein